MTPARALPTAFPAAHQRREPCGVPVAAILTPDRPMPTPADLLRSSRACRAASGAYAVEGAAIGRREGAGSAAAAEAGHAALEMQQASHQFAELAQDGELHAWIAHRAAGGDVVLAPLPVVVGDAQRAAAPANDRFWRRAAARLLRRSA